MTNAGSLVTLAVLATGCVVRQSDALLDTHWDLKNVAGDKLTACPAGFNTGTVVSQEVDVDGFPLGAPILDLFDCQARGGTIVLSPTLYQISVAIENRDFDGNLIASYTESVPQIIDLTFNDDTYSTQILNDGGRLTFAWDLRDTAGKALPCSALGAGELQAISTEVATPTNVADHAMLCEDRVVPVAGPDAVSRDIELVAGTYNVQVEAVNGQTAISDVATFANVVMHDRDDLVDLGTVTLHINTSP